MKRLLFCTSLMLLFCYSSAQPEYEDSLQQALSVAKNDTTRALIYSSLSRYFSIVQLDSGLYYAQKVVQLSRKANYKYGEALGYYNIAGSLDKQGSYPKALENAFKCLAVAEQLKYSKLYMISLAYQEIGILNKLNGDNQRAIVYLKYSVKLGEQSGRGNEILSRCFAQIANAYLGLNQLDSALFYARNAYNSPNTQYLSLSTSMIGNVYERLNNYPLAEKYYREAIQTAKQYNSLNFLARAYYNLGVLFNKVGRIDTSVYYAKECLMLSLSRKFYLFAMDASALLTKAYESQHNTDSALKYMKTVLVMKDSVFNQANMQQFQNIAFNEEQRREQLQAVEERYQNQMRIYILVTGLIIVLLLALVLYRNNKQKQKANLLLQQQKEKVESTLQELKSTQAQLIQSEKMASLGQLTAGIAHEIQNPLNFVNNFSEINTELITELKEEIEKGDLEEVKAIASDIEENEQKIIHHGKRADSIVKGMLQHSRASTGKKELTDVNVLADECLRLSYHGMRAKDKEFNATINTDFDEGIGKINVVPQDISRVLLNLLNNAFYAVDEKKKEAPTLKGENYEPTVCITTKHTNSPSGAGSIEIVVKDNGTDIPQNIIDKIFQPFFTTKPTGQGTGLGLSLSYDIVKAHGGEIQVESSEGEGAEFIVLLPTDTHKLFT